MLQICRLFVYSMLISLVAQSCTGTKDRSQFSNEEIGRYITAIVPGLIQSGDPVRFRFAVPVDTTQPHKILSFSPAVKGKYYWEDVRTLRFEPSESWTPDKEYQAIVSLGDAIKDVDPAMKRVSFPFRIQPARLNIYFDPLQPEFEVDQALYVLHGRLSSSIPLDSQVLNTILNMSQGKLTWLSNGSSRDHDFMVSNIKPGSSLRFKWDGRPIGSPEKGEKEISAPPADKLVVMDYSIGGNSERKVSIYFSQKLSSAQDLTGLITVNENQNGFTWQRSGHILDIYPVEEWDGSLRIQLDQSVISSLGFSLGEPYSMEFSINDEIPQLRMIGSGVITPGQTEFLVPFEAINLRSVKVEVVRLFENNILPFLQSSNLQDPDGMYMLSRIIHSSTVELSQLRQDDNRSKWTRYGLDIAPLVKLAPGSLYQVRIGFAGEDTYQDCYNSHNYERAKPSYGELSSFWEYVYDYDGFDWEHESDPCYPAFYNPSRFISRNILASDIGLIAKQNETGDFWIYASEISTAKPISNLEIAVIDGAQQTMMSVKTNSEGFANGHVPRNAAFLIASRGEEKGYLKLLDGLSLSVTEFDAGGTQYQEGLRGYLFGERDVWRPGDSVYLQFILWDPEGKIDSRHPVQLTVTNPLGQKRIQQTTTHSIGGIYPLSFATKAGDITGSYMAKVRVGDATFTKSLKIETIKPNRLKIDLKLPEQIVFSQQSNLTVEADWLYGSPASNLKTNIEAHFSPMPIKPKGFGEFVFQDPARRTPNTVFTVFEGTLNEQGKSSFSLPDLSAYLPEGQMKMTMKTRVFEQGGDFSTDQTSAIFHPYLSYAGVNIPKNRWGFTELLVNEANTIRLASVSPEGKGISGRKVSVGIYQAQWRWWWDQTAEDITQYNSKLHLGAFHLDTLMTGADGTVNYTIRPSQYGSYLIRVCDEVSGHCAGTFYYAGTWGDPSQPNEAANRLTFGADKTEYQAGERVKLKIPSSRGAKLLLTIEKNNKVLSSEWHDATGDITEVSFNTTPEMMPNVYASVTLIQPYQDRKNDMPLRMYGTIPVSIKDVKTELHPVIDMQPELQPGKSFTVKVSEKDKQAMAYTIAIVDEGLLGLTRYKTPNPWEYFHRKEALSVQTYDMFDLVAGGYGATLDRLLSIGGDDAIQIGDVPDAQRYKPVVLFGGPYYLEKGKEQKHEFTMPQYIGAVRVMVIASNRSQWGATDRSVPVKSDLMVQSTLPRVVSPGEIIQVPVHVINTSANIRDANVTITTNDMAKISGASTQSLAFQGQGDKMTTFQLEIPKRPGILKVKVNASSGSLKAEQEIELDVRLPMPPKTVVKSQAISGGQSWSSAIEPPGIEGTNSYTVELSQMPAINLQERLNFLIRYPYGCLEQTLSAIYPQLYLENLSALTEEQQRQVRENITGGIKELRKFSLPSGGFTYWPGETRLDPWVNSYAGHVLIEASRQGYPVDSDILDKWRKVQKADAQAYRPGSYMRDDLSQAYRLFTLALDGQPLWSAMNRMKAQKNIEQTAGWMLAATYAIANKKEAADEILKSLPSKVQTYAESYGTYGSELRDEAIMLQTYLTINRTNEALTLAKGVAAKLSSTSWYSTQSLGWALASMGKMAKIFDGKEINASLQVNGKSEQIKSSKAIITRSIAESAKDLSVQNHTDQPLFVTFTGTGRPLTFDKVTSQNNLDFKVRYLDMNGKPLQVSRLAQGTDFIVQFEVKYGGELGYTMNNMALSYFFPSGWEISNQRLDGFAGRFTNSSVRYANYRDDKVYLFFDMSKGTWVYNFMMTATYAGKYLLPDIVCESMYIGNVRARIPGQWVEVVSDRSN